MYEMTHMYKSLVFDDEFLAQGLHLMGTYGYVLLPELLTNKIPVINLFMWIDPEMSVKESLC